MGRGADSKGIAIDNAKKAKMGRRVILKLVQQQRHCQIVSQPGSRKSSRKLGGVVHNRPDAIQKRGGGEEVWLRQRGKMSTKVHEVAGSGRKNRIKRISHATVGKNLRSERRIFPTVAEQIFSAFFGIFSAQNGNFYKLSWPDIYFSKKKVLLLIQCFVDTW